MPEYCSECHTSFRLRDGRVFHDRACSHWEAPQAPSPAATDPREAARHFDNFVFLGAYIPISQVGEVSAAIAKARGWTV